MEENKLKLAQDIYEVHMEPEYLNSSWLKEQPQTVYRLDKAGGRYYYVIDEQTGEPTFFISVTTFIKQSMPTPQSLITWIAQMGEKEAKAYAEERAMYGSLLHIEIGELLVNAQYDLDSVPQKLELYMEKHHLPYSFKKYADDLRKDILAFSQCMIDYGIEPVAVEIVLTHPEWKIAGAVDIVCWMNVDVDALSDEVFKSGPRKGQKKPIRVKKRVLCIIDIKSGRKSFYDEHKIQLHAYKEMWNLHFPDMPIERVYNFSPKDWRKSTPTYNFTDQTNAKIARKLEKFVELARIDDDSKDNSLTICHGVITIADGLYNNIEYMELAELVKKRHEPLDMNDTKDK